MKLATFLLLLLLLREFKATICAAVNDGHNYDWRYFDLHKQPLSPKVVKSVLDLKSRYLQSKLQVDMDAELKKRSTNDYMNIDDGSIMDDYEDLLDTDDLNILRNSGMVDYATWIKLHTNHIGNRKQRQSNEQVEDEEGLEEDEDEFEEEGIYEEEDSLNDMASAASDYDYDSAIQNQT